MDGPEAQPNGPKGHASDAPLVDHLAELRYRILLCLGVLVVAFFVFYRWSDEVFALLTRPLRKVKPDLRLAALTVTEGFFATMKVAFYASALTTLPIMVWQAWRFVEPGLLAVEKTWVGFLLWPAVAAFYAGGTFCHLVLLPVGLEFLLNGYSGTFQTVLSVSEYIDFTVLFSVFTGVLFELPLVIVLLDLAGIVPVESLRRRRRHLIVGAFIVGAVASPPDAVSQILVSLPIVVLGEMGIWGATLVRRFVVKPRADSSDTYAEGAKSA